MKQSPVAFFLSIGGDGGKTRLVVTQGITLRKVRGYAREHFPEIEKGGLRRTAEDKVPKRFTSSIALERLAKQSFVIAVLEVCDVVICLKWITASGKKEKLGVEA